MATIWHLACWLAVHPNLISGGGGMSFHRAAAWLLTVALVVVGASLAGGSNEVHATTTARLSPAITAWLSTAADSATHKTIVTFRDPTGLTKLDGLGIASQKLAQLPMAFATLTAAQIRIVAGWPETRSIWDDEANELILDKSVPFLGVDRVWAGNGLAQGYTGVGVNVAVIDTGVDSTHPDLAGRVISYQVIGDPFDAKGVHVVAAPTTDTYGHGTHVSGTVVGTGAASGGTHTGVAFGGMVYSFKTDAGLVLLNSWSLAVFDWILNNPQANIRISTNSWGSGNGSDYDPDHPINVATKTLYDTKVTVIFAAGNGGGPNTLNQYAVSPWVISVAAGATLRKGTAEDHLKLATFSSRGRIDGNWDRRRAQNREIGLYRPTITAPGSDIVAARSAQAVVMTNVTANPFYVSASGTSMAAPHAAGVAALLLQVRPELGPAEIISIFEGTARNMPAHEIFEAGIGYLDAYAAVVAAEKGQVTFRPSTNGRTPKFRMSSSATFGGTVLTGTWSLAQCPDTTGLLNHHKFEVANGTDAVYAEIEWPSATDLIYLRLYDPSCQVVAESAGLLSIGTVRHRAVLVTNPVAGTYTVAVYGRINAPTTYTGAFETYVKR